MQQVYSIISKGDNTKMDIEKGILKIFFYRTAKEEEGFKVVIFI
jgi:hypothetical protein